MINLLLEKMESKKTAETCGLQGAYLRFINDFRRIIISMRDCGSARAFYATLFFCGQVGVWTHFAPRMRQLSNRTKIRSHTLQREHCSNASRCFHFGETSMKDIRDSEIIIQKHPSKIDLMNLSKRSHNQIELEESMHQIVRFLARRAAEEDFSQYLAALELSKNTDKPGDHHE